MYFWNSNNHLKKKEREKSVASWKDYDFIRTKYMQDGVDDMVVLEKQSFADNVTQFAKV